MILPSQEIGPNEAPGADARTTVVALVVAVAALSSTIADLSDRWCRSRPSRDPRRSSVAALASTTAAPRRKRELLPRPVHPGLAIYDENGELFASYCATRGQRGVPPGPRQADRQSRKAAARCPYDRGERAWAALYTSMARYGSRAARGLSGDTRRHHGVSMLAALLTSAGCSARSRSPSRITDFATG